MAYYRTVDSSAFLERASKFMYHLESLKTELSPRDFQWYPYATLASLATLKRLLRQAPSTLFDPLLQSPVADIGCADGDLAFFLESLGYDVDAIDNPLSNFNQMKGVYALKAALNSAVRIHSIDVDLQFTLPSERYGLVWFLGTLYHLKNPYQALETLARRARNCFLSTRIAKFTPDQEINLQRLPVAYLLAHRELNDDPSNYWIFSEAGLRRIIDRTGWDLCGYVSTGSNIASDPVNPERDERVYCLLQSRSAADPHFASNLELLSGWHGVETGGWRWTERKFSAQSRHCAHKLRGILRLGITLTDRSMMQHGSITLAAFVNGTALSPQTFDRAGNYEYIRRLPRDLLGSDSIKVEFELDKVHAPGDLGLDPRELGTVVSVIALD